MPLFQSDEGKFLSTKKINNAQKMQQIEQNQIEDNKENDQESPQMPRLNTYEAKVMLSTKKPSSFIKTTLKYKVVTSPKGTYQLWFMYTE